MIPGMVAISVRLLDALPDDDDVVGDRGFKPRFFHVPELDIVANFPLVPHSLTTT